MLEDFYAQTGICGAVIMVLAAAAVYAAVRGTVTAAVVKKQARVREGAVERIIGAAAEYGEGGRGLMIQALMQRQLRGVFGSMYFLKLCAAVGPLLGLLGTVMGMVKVFSTLSEKTMPDPALLAGGIWQALLTTVMGLCLAIPALMIHYFLLMQLRSLRTHITLRVQEQCRAREQAGAATAAGVRAAAGKREQEMQGQVMQERKMQGQEMKELGTEDSRE